MNREHIFIKYVVLCSVFVACLLTFLPVQAVQEIYWVKAYPENAVMNTPSTIKIMAQFAYDANLIRTGVNLIRVDQTGKQLAALGTLYDDGTHGDDAAGDNIFTCQVSINEPQPTFLYYRASAAYKGTLKRLVSDILTLPVKTTVTSEEVKSQVVTALTTGDVASARNNLSTGKNMDFLDSMNALPPSQRDLLQNWIGNATLIKDSPSLKVYGTQWVDEGGVTHNIKFMMIPNALGEWKIVW